MAKKRSSKKQTKFSAGRASILICIVVLIVVAVSGCVWWRKVYSDPGRVFWGMLSSNLSTQSVTRRVIQSSEEGKLDQTTMLSLGSQSTAHSLTTLSQPGAAGNDTVVTENIGTPDADYVRYQSIDTSQRDKDGKPLNFTNVLGVWGKGESGALSGQTGAQLLNQSIIGVIPFAPLDKQSRQHLLDMIRTQQVYTTDYKKVTRRHQTGRLVYDYEVTIKPEAYVAMLKTFTKGLGLKQLDNVNPADYAGRPTQKVVFTVDVASRELTDIHYTGTNRDEQYSSYGLQTITDIPTHTVPVSELQTRLQQLQ